MTFDLISMLIGLLLGGSIIGMICSYLGIKDNKDWYDLCTKQNNAWHDLCRTIIDQQEEGE